MWSEILFGVPAPEPTEAPTPEPTEEPAPEPVEERILFIDSMSSAKDIQTMQMALYKFGLLNADGIQPGALDQGTLEAVAAFQQKLNEHYGTELIVIDPMGEEVYIDEITLDYLLYQSLDI